MLVASLWLAVIVATPPSVGWTVAGLGLAAMVVWFVSYGSSTVGVSDGVLHAGRARIPAALLGTATALDAEGMRRQAGVDADARAHLLLRPYLKRGVRIDIADPSDPTPYWLVSMRHPDRLVDALARVQRPTR